MKRLLPLLALLACAPVFAQKISALPSGVQPTGPELIPAVQSGLTVSITAAQFLAYIQANGGGMTWPTGSASIACYSGSTSWCAGYNASNLIPANFLPAALASSTSINGVTIPPTSSTAVTAPTSTTANNCYLTTTTAGLASTGSCPGGTPAFSVVTAGTNTTAAMVVGSGASLTTTNNLDILGSSTGYTTIESANAGATNYVATLPAATDTVVELTQTQTLSNKTFVAPALGTPASGVATNLTGTAAALNIGGTAANITATSNSTLTSLSALASANGSTVPASAGTLIGTGANETMSTGFTLGYGSGTINANEWAGLTLPTLVSGDCLTNNGSILSWTGCGGSAAWSAITGGTNTAALVVGSGGSLGTSGSGTIAATSAPVTGITGLGTGVGTFLATPTAANLGSAVTGAGAVAGGGIAVSGTWPTQTVSSSYSVRTVSGSTDTILSTDCANGVYYSNAGSVAVTLPQATGSFAGCGVDISASSATTVTITPTTSTINGAATAVVGPSLWDQVVAVSGNYNAYGTAVSFNAGVTYLIDTGTKFTLGTGTGTCASTSALVGGTATGSFECTGTSGASTIVVNLPTAPNGWFCEGNDLTTTSDTVHQTVSSTTSCTLSGTIVANDNINFLAVGH